MNALYYYLIGFILVWILAFLLKDKLNITMDGIVLMLKTDKLRGIIDKIANLCPRFWKWAMNSSIPLGIIFMILMVISLIYSLKLMFNTPTVSLILPGVDIPGSPLYIPFGTGLIALATVLIVHEGGHGILARVENVSIKSVGLLLLAIIPGAFVEPDDDEIKELNGLAKIRIYSAGPMFNIGLCIIALLLSLAIGGFLVSENVYTADGMEIVSVIAGSPSEGVLSEGMVIRNINGANVTDYNSYIKSLNNTQIGDQLNITTDKGSYTITTSSSPNNESKSYMGIRAQENVIVTPEAQTKYGTIIPWILTELKEIFNLMFILNMAVGTFNLLPMKPLDGGLIFEELLKAKITEKRRLDFNNTLNKIIKPLPEGIRYWISRRFNSLLNFLSKYSLSDEKADKILKYTSSLFIFILVVLIAYGLIPGILKMF